jgi:hypothetical protein
MVEISLNAFLYRSCIYVLTESPNWSVAWNADVVKDSRRKVSL